MKEDKNAGISLRSLFWDWLKEITPRPNAEDYCQIMADSPEAIKVRIFTHDYRYSIFVTSRPDDPDNLKKALLSCTASRRKSLAGLTEHLYADLVDGKFCRETWELIKAAILRFELVKLTAKARGEQWHMETSHYESHGKHYFDEWLQKGDEKKEHKTYELADEKEEGEPKSAICK